MNIKKATNSQLSTTESKKKKKKLRKENRYRIIGMEITWRVISYQGVGGEWGK